MRTKLTKKLLSALLTVAMLAAMVPAAFAADTYTVTYMNGSEQIATETNVAAGSHTLTQTASKTGFDFKGWTLDSSRTLWAGDNNGSDGSFVAANGQATISGNVTYYAVFETNAQFDNLSTVAVSNTAGVNIGQAVASYVYGKIQSTGTITVKIAASADAQKYGTLRLGTTAQSQTVTVPTDALATVSNLDYSSLAYLTFLPSGVVSDAAFTTGSTSGGYILKYSVADAYGNTVFGTLYVKTTGVTLGSYSMSTSLSGSVSVLGNNGSKVQTQLDATLTNQKATIKSVKINSVSLSSFNVANGIFKNGSTTLTVAGLLGTEFSPADMSNLTFVGGTSNGTVTINYTATYTVNGLDSTATGTITINVGTTTSATISATVPTFSESFGNEIYLDGTASTYTTVYNQFNDLFTEYGLNSASAYILFPTINNATSGNNTLTYQGCLSLADGTPITAGTQVTLGQLSGTALKFTSKTATAWTQTFYIYDTTTNSIALTGTLTINKSNSNTTLSGVLPTSYTAGNPVNLTSITSSSVTTRSLDAEIKNLANENVAGNATTNIYIKFTSAYNASTVGALNANGVGVVTGTAYDVTSTAFTFVPGTATSGTWSGSYTLFRGDPTGITNSTTLSAMTLNSGTLQISLNTSTWTVTGNTANSATNYLNAITNDSGSSVAAQFTNITSAYFVKFNSTTCSVGTLSANTSLYYPLAAVGNLTFTSNATAGTGTIPFTLYTSANVSVGSGTLKFVNAASTAVTANTAKSTTTYLTSLNNASGTSLYSQLYSLMQKNAAYYVSFSNTASSVGSFSMGSNRVLYSALKNYTFTSTAIAGTWSGNYYLYESSSSSTVKASGTLTVVVSGTTTATTSVTATTSSTAAVALGNLANTAGSSVYTQLNNVMTSAGATYVSFGTVTGTYGTLSATAGYKYLATALSSLYFTPASANGSFSTTYTLYDASGNTISTGTLTITTTGYATATTVYGVATVGTTTTLSNTYNTAKTATVYSQLSALCSAYGSYYVALTNGSTSVGYVSNTARVYYTDLASISYTPVTAGTWTGSYAIYATASTTSPVASGTISITNSGVSHTSYYVDVTYNANTTYYFDKLMDLTDKGIFDGYLINGARYFKPANSITYGEALKVIMMAAGYSDLSGTGYNWASPFMTRAIKDGLLSSSVNLQKYITRVEFCTIAAKALKLSTSISVTNPFTDTTNIYVLAMYRVGIIEGTTTTTFSPNVAIKRSEMAKIIWYMYNM